MSDQKAQIIGELQRKGKRITGQRKILLDVILEGKWSSCKEIYYMASKKDPTIGLATVYRMVGVLEEMGFLSRGYRYSYPVEDKKQAARHIKMCSLFFINVLFHWEIIAIAYSFKYNKKDTLHFKVQELRLYNKRGL